MTEFWAATLNELVICLAAFVSFAGGLWIMLKVSDWLDEVSYNHCFGKSSRLARWVVRSIENRVTCEFQRELLVSVCKDKRGE